MRKTTKQLERNISASFGYVKKDILMLNDVFSDLNEKIRHLSMNNATLLSEVEKLRDEMKKGSKKSKKGKSSK
jgi:regulator of replication initiation timing